MRLLPVIAAVLVTACAACTGPATGTPPRSVEVGAGASGSVGAPEWVSVTDADLGVNGADLPQHGLTPAAGIGIGYQVPDATGTLRSKMCTLGPATDAGYVTAGHCGVGTATTGTFLSPDRQGSVTQPFTAVTRAEDQVGDPYIDSALVPSASVTARVGTMPVAGVLTVAAVQNLPPGTEVCFDGAKSGVSCGPVVSTDDAGELHFGAQVIAGDSGAPVFLVDGRARSVTLVGVLAADDDSDHTAYATYLDPALARLDARVLVNHAARAPQGASGYSERVVDRP
ncbi:chymotrypsin family serine protease [Tsukamurella soli]|uniref:Trypsin n=1 Tax=Tsukamurella soli TaxID=644556 RepID=A0ABP8KCI5_9ACTN